MSNPDIVLEISSWSISWLSIVKKVGFESTTGNKGVTGVSSITFFLRVKLSETSLTSDNTSEFLFGESEGWEVVSSNWFSSKTRSFDRTSPELWYWLKIPIFKVGLESTILTAFEVSLLVVLKIPFWMRWQRAFCLFSTWLNWILFEVEAWSKDPVLSALTSNIG